ncbi:distal tail protein Dit [Tepidibacter thalassicus]|uniref:Putative phage tail component, N-terminal domain-containing protein n=1 Tax=Tepidibacter thalassicus DSM 15285 TaxID=1123350 RepID=A0A1M5PVD9_9FIRM|nr:distal tail protein Dit [Tepidibacter thalassicus]SHH05818.1 putative phage tail component, N-terminal domain-containing protein [Tepidibacter thalassicus DSM 15285]
MLSFNFNGKDSYLDFGILIAKRPTIPSTKRRVSYIDIPGRHSRLKYDESTFEDITIGIECAVKEKENLVRKLDEIKAWLFNAGESDLIFSFEPDKKYIAQVVNSIDFEQVFTYTSRFLILFSCRPFKYAVQNSLLTITESSNIINPGTIESEPIIRVYGNGDILLKINEQHIELKEITNKIIINSIIQDAYDDEGNILNTKMNGEFPKFKIAENNLTWTGNVKKIEILPNWRWL